MKFSYKPDFENAQRHWEAFWEGEIIDRPCARVVAPKDGIAAHPHPPYLHHPKDDFDSYLRSYELYASSTYFGGDAIPFFMPNFGPDSYAAFLGADLDGFSLDDNTSWAKPFVVNWTLDAIDMRRPHGYWWQAALDFTTKTRRAAEGRFAVAVWDLHSNMDCLAAVRGPQNLCFDLMDCPNAIEAALEAVRGTFPAIYDSLYLASGQDKTGCTTWLPFYSEKKFAVIQCDFICMIAPDAARRLVLPALEEEAGFLDHCCYHLDGPGALAHLDDILSIESIDAIQWVPGAGSAPVPQWMDLLKKIQDAGKSLYIGATGDEVKYFHKELRPDRVFYDVTAGSQLEAEELLNWLRLHT